MNFFVLNLLNEGGPTFMYTILLMLIICIALIIKAFIKGDEDGKTSTLIKHISLLALSWGFLGLFIGLIFAFDAINSINGDISTGVLAGGLKIGLLSPSFGLLTFLIARVGLTALTFRKK